MTNSEYIKQILAAIHIDGERKIYLNGQLYGSPFKDQYLSQPSNKMLFQTLEGLLYNNFYCKNNDAVSASVVPAFPEIEKFIADLGEANKSEENFDEGWLVEHVDTQGQMIARKGNMKRYVFAGEFLNTSSFHQKPFANTAIKLIARKEYRNPGAGFYYVFGNTLGEDNSDQLVRIYFNIKPDGASALINNLTIVLNETQIPFTFKCLNHPFYYTRCDTAVLYFDKRYSNLVFESLQAMYNGLRSFLNDDTPSFTLALAPGLAFAENPIKQDESFGTHCSKMIVQGIMHAYNSRLPKDHWFAEIKNIIERHHGYKSVDTLYLNPETKYPYCFPIFNN